MQKGFDLTANSTGFGQLLDHCGKAIRLYSGAVGEHRGLYTVARPLRQPGHASTTVRHLYAIFPFLH